MIVQKVSFSAFKLNTWPRPHYAILSMCGHHRQNPLASNQMHQRILIYNKKGSKSSLLAISLKILSQILFCKYKYVSPSAVYTIAQVHQNPLKILNNHGVLVVPVITAFWINQGQKLPSSPCSGSYMVA